MHSLLHEILHSFVFFSHETMGYPLDEWARKSQHYQSDGREYCINNERVVNENDEATIDNNRDDENKRIDIYTHTGSLIVEECRAKKVYSLREKTCWHV